MPSDRIGGRGRSAIYKWRVKCGREEVFADERKFRCETFIRGNQQHFEKKLKLIRPNY